MYKGASRSLQARHAVDKPHPSRGYIDGGPDASAVLPPISALSYEQAEAEAERLRFEMSRLEQDLAIAKATDKSRQIAAIGQRKATTQDRLKEVRRRIRELNIAYNGSVVGAAIKQIVDAETAARIFERAAELRASRIEARSDETPQEVRPGGREPDPEGGRPNDSSLTPQKRSK